MASQGFKTWTARIGSGTFTKSQVIQWCNSITAKSYGEWGGKSSSVTEEEAITLLKRFTAAVGVNITAEHAEKGMAWAEKLRPKMADQFPDGYVDACRKREVTYRFVGAFIVEHGRARSSFIPTYRAAYPRPDQGTIVVFDYAYTGWTSAAGVGIDVMNVRESAIR